MDNNYVTKSNRELECLTSIGEKGLLKAAFNSTYLHVQASQL